LIFRELPEAFADLGLEVVVHVLQIQNGHGHLGTGGAVISLATGYEHFHVLVCVRSVLDARQHVTGAQGTFCSVGRGFTENRGDDERTARGIQRRRNFIGAILASTRRGRAAHRGIGFGMLGLLLLCCDLRSHFVGNLLLDLRRKSDGATAAGCRLILGSRFGIGLGLSCRAGFVCCLEIRSQQIVGYPECRRGVNRIRIEVIAIISVPRSPTPTPAKRNWRGPGIVGPAIESGGEVHPRNIAVVGVPVPVVPAIGVGIAMATIVIGAAHIRMAAPVVSVLGIATAVAIADNSATVAPPGLESPLAMSAVVDGHSAAGMNSADMAGATEVRSRTTLSLNTGSLTAGVEIVGAAIRAGFGISAGGMVPRHVGGAGVRCIGGGTMRPAGRAAVCRIGGGTMRPAGRAGLAAGGRASVGSISGGTMRPASRGAVRASPAGGWSVRASPASR